MTLTRTCQEWNALKSEHAHADTWLLDDACEQDNIDAWAAWLEDLGVDPAEAKRIAESTGFGAAMNLLAAFGTSIPLEDIATAIATAWQDGLVTGIRYERGNG